MDRRPRRRPRERRPAGEDPATVADLAPVVLAAAAPYRRADGSYLFRNAFRWAVGRAPAG
nr:hypothetical protein GCM10025730_47710 [Promicromonospora thailandica]